MTHALDNLTVKLDSEAMNTLMVKAILDAIEPAQREAILAEAVKALTTAMPDRYGYSRDKITPLQAAFDQAVRDLATETAKSMLTDNVELRARINAVVGEAMTALIDNESGLRSKVSEGIGSAVQTWVYARR